MKHCSTPSTADVWNAYAPFFHLEESTVFSRDLREMRFYRALRKEHPGRCLEIGAGSGRLSSSLFLGDPVIALEPSPAMLSLWPPRDARRARRVRGTGQQLPFRAEAFGFVCFPYNGLQCILEPDHRRAVLAEAHRVLEPGGVFLFEISPSFSTRSEEPLTRRYHTPLPDHRFLTLDEEVLRLPRRSTVLYRMTYTLHENGSPETPCPVDLELAAFPVLEAVDETVRTGFPPPTLWGDYDHSPFDASISPRLLVLAKKE